jgi:hypothetical protein
LNSQTANPKSSILPHILGALALAVALYVGGFWFDQHLRNRRGPWDVTFGFTPESAPMLVIQQEHLGVRDVRIIFLDEKTNSPTARVQFDRPGVVVPWGQIKHQDLTYLPGVITLNLFGHEIEMLPRTLYVNRRSIPWQSQTNILLRELDLPTSLPDPAEAAREVRAGARRINDEP